MNYWRNFLVFVIVTSSPILWRYRSRLSIVTKQIAAKDTLLEEYEGRMRTFRDTCAQYKNNMTKFSRDLPLVFVPEKNFSYCMLSKTGTTTWAHQLYQLLSGRKNALYNYHLTLRHAHHLPNRDMSLLKPVFSFLFVRHPFLKLLSAFRMQSHISAFRRKMKAHDIDPKNFTAFVSYFVANEYTTNMHFYPYWYRCQPCNLHLDFIGQMETFDRDHDYVVNELSLDLPKMLLEKKFNVRKGPSTTSYAEVAFESLTKTQVLQLYKVYELDFRLFGYSIEPYLSYARGW